MNTITIDCSGPDALTFLQGQLCGDIRHLDSPLLTAHCNPQGRVVFTAIISELNQTYQLTIPEAMQTIVITELKKYGTFSKINFKVSAAQNTTTDIREGLPVIHPQTSGLFVAQRLNLHLLNAISFDKGCYIGQEVIARLHYKGKMKHHMYLASCQETTLLQPADELTNTDNKKVGHVIDSQLINDKQYILFICPIADVTSPIYTKHKTLLDISELPYPLD